MSLADELKKVEQEARSPFDKKARTKYRPGAKINPLLAGAALLGVVYILESPWLALAGAAAYWATKSGK